MHPLDHAYFRLDWAKKRFAELEAINRGYISEEADFLRSRVRIDIAVDSSVPDIHVPAKFGTLIPVSFPILIGEIAQHLRAILDYLVYRLAELDSGSPQERTQFPVYDCPEQFRGKNRDRLLKGVNNAHATAIERLQPYNGGHWTKRLVTISNRDKHMDLTVALAGSAVRMRAGRTPNPPAGPDDEGLSLVIEIPREHAVIRRDYQVGVDQPMYMEFFFALYIKFDDGRHVITSVQEIVTEVGNTLAYFKPEF